MASSSRIKGITIEIGGDTTGLDKALNDVNKEINTTQKNLKDINKLLKLDPGNAELLAQKQRVLAEQSQATAEKLKTLKEAAKEANKQLAEGKISQDQYDALQREIAECESQMRELTRATEEFGSVTKQQIKAAGDKMQDFGRKLSDTGKKLSVVSLALVGLGAKCVEYASDTEEAMNKVEVAFGGSADAVKRFADTTLDSYGIAKGTALDMAALFGDMGTSMGLSQQEAAKMSTSMVGLAGDLASFKNIGLDQATNALKGVFTGETESLKNIGVVMTQTNLDAFALAEGFGKTTAK